MAINAGTNKTMEHNRELKDGLMCIQQMDIIKGVPQINGEKIL